MYEEYEEDDNKVYCYCKKPYIEGDMMIGNFIL